MDITNNLTLLTLEVMENRKRRNILFTNKVVRVLLNYLDLYIEKNWVGSGYFVIRRTLINEVAPEWLRLVNRRKPLTLPATSIENLAAQLGSKTLTRAREYEYFGPLSIQCRVYRSPDGESRALVAADIDSVLSMLRVRTLYTARIAPLVDTPLADAPRIEDARIILAPCAPRP